MAHRNPSSQELKDIYDRTEVIAVVGASDDPDKPSHQIPAYLQREGYRIVPVNPGDSEVLGERALDELADVDEQIDVVDVFRPADETPDIAHQAVLAGAKVLWLQTGIVSEEAATIARDGGLTVVMDACMGAMHGSLGLGPGPH